MIRELDVRALFVQAGEAAIAGHIGRQDGCKPSLYPLGGQSCTPEKSGTAYPFPCP
jgi:hypothetical protein